jgi:nucleotide-binding universal stress UspA family protein
MRKIIVGIDEPERSRDAVALAAQIARATGAELEALCAYPYEDVIGRASNSIYRQDLSDDAEKRIAQACEGIRDLPEIVRRTLADPSPARAIQDRATPDAASLIVIASIRRGEAGRVLAGTTAERLLHGAPCPVAVAPKGYHERPDAPIETIGVAYNSSRESKAALAGAVAMARALDARLRVISVLDTLWLGTPALMARPGYIRMPEDVRAEAREHLATVVEDVPDDVQAEAVSLEGDPEHQLAAQTSSVDLMITGSRAYGPHRAVLLGSVSGRLVRDAACPVIVLPRSIESPFAALFRAPSETQAVR